MQYLRFDLYHSGIAGHHDVTFLYRALQLHGAAGQRGKSQRGFARQLEHSEVVLSLQLAAILVPPDAGCPPIAQHHYLVGASAGLADDTHVRQSNLDPALDFAG